MKNLNDLNKTMNITCKKARKTKLSVQQIRGMLAVLKFNRKSSTPERTCRLDHVYDDRCRCICLVCSDWAHFSLTQPSYYTSLGSHSLPMCTRNHVKVNLFNIFKFTVTIKNSSHILHPLLPPPTIASENYNLRPRAHHITLPKHSGLLNDANFITRVLYKNIYWY